MKLDRDSVELFLESIRDQASRDLGKETLLEVDRTGELRSRGWRGSTT